MSLSVCLIVKNEEEYLRNCLESVRFADEIIVVDTGSTDNTKAIAQEYGTIIDYEWQDDFSAARNYALSRATQDWILSIDADERVKTPETLQGIAALRPDHPVYCVVQIENALPADVENETNYLSKWSTGLRLFTNSGFAFRNKIHENIYASAQEMGAEQRIANVQLHHIGYAVKDRTERLQQNRQLLEQMIAEHPDDYYTLMNYGKQLIAEGENKKGRQILKQVDRESDLVPMMKAPALNYIAQSYFNDFQLKYAEKYAKQSLELEPRQVTALAILTAIFHKRRDWLKAKRTSYLIVERVRAFQTHQRVLSEDIAPSLQEAVEYAAFYEGVYLGKIDPNKQTVAVT